MTDSLLATGLSAIMTNTAAMRVTANNIANVNTPGYVRRVVSQETVATGGQMAGVALSDIQRATNAFFGREALSASSDFSRYNAQSSIMDQLNASLGSPGDGTSLSSRLDALYAALGTASLDPGLQANRQGALYQFQTLAESVEGLSASITTMQQRADQDVGIAMESANQMMKEIYELNLQIGQAFIAGDRASGLLDQRDLTVQKLAEIVGIRTMDMPDGRKFVSTQDGVSLVGDVYSQLSHRPSSGPAYYPITIQSVNPKTEDPIGTAQAFDSHTGSGQLRGLLDMRDTQLNQVAAELGAFAQGLAQTFNAQHNANTAVPPPATMTGRETGLLATDSLGFSGVTSIGIANASGVLQQRIDVNFGAGTISVNGAVVGATGTTIGGFVTALDTALGANGDAGFADGVLTLSANGSNGLIINNDATTPATRGGLGFSHFFGLNDVFRATGNSVQTTGLSASDAGGFTGGGTISLLLKGPLGERLNETTVTVAPTDTIGDVIVSLNTAFTGKASFALDANGQLSMTTTPAFRNYSLEVGEDTTQRGTTEQGFTQLFGLGMGEAIGRATGFSLTEQLAGEPQHLAFAQSTLSTTSLLGDIIAGTGDNRGLIALQNLSRRPTSFAGVGALQARTTTLSDYAATLYQDISSRGNAVESSRAAQSARWTQAKLNQSQSEGVNMDEELANMMSLQQAYNAGARILKVSEELFDALIGAI